MTSVRPAGPDPSCGFCVAGKGKVDERFRSDSSVTFATKRRPTVFAALCGLLLMAGCSSPSQSSSNARTAQPAVSGRTGSFNPAPARKVGDWTSQAGDYANSRYSGLDQINSGNVGRLKAAWTFSDGALYSHEGASLVPGGRAMPLRRGHLAR